MLTLTLARNVEGGVIYHAGTTVEFDGDDRELRDLIDLDEPIPIIMPDGDVMDLTPDDLDFA